MMTEQGGRVTEKDLFGNKGGEIVKENYLGGKIYFCARCQKF
jgi:formamidopyrimidine-DNA glycosylase